MIPLGNLIDNHSPRDKTMYLRRQFPTLLSLSLALHSFGCVGDGDDGTCDNAAAEGYHTITDGDVTREYILHLPSNYDATVEYPLVISFHGNGGCAEMFSSGSDFGDGDSDLSSQADANGFIVAYPQGVARAKGGTEWDPGDDGSTNMNDNDVANITRAARHYVEVARAHRLGAGGAPFDNMHWRQLPPKN